MLLHVIEAPAEIDPPVYFAVSRVASTRSQRFAQNMRDAVAFIDHFNDSRSAQFSSIERLATGGWIERSAVEINAATVPIYIHHMSLKLGQIAIVTIKALGHSASIMARGRAGSFETRFFHRETDVKRVRQLPTVTLSRSARSATVVSFVRQLRAAFPEAGSHRYGSWIETRSSTIP